MSQEVVVGCCFYPRFRPFIKTEVGPDKQAKSSVAFHKSGQKLLCKYGIEKPVEFVFDKVFNMNATQQILFEGFQQPIVDSIMHGFNCSLVSYGKKGSGKSYTLFGNKVEANIREDEGLAQRFIRHIFTAIEEVGEEYEFTISFSAYEVTNDGDAIIDLMNIEDEELEVSYHEKNKVIEIDRLSEMYVSDATEFLENLSDLFKNLHDDTTLFLEVTITKRKLGETEKKVARLTFIDLNQIFDEEGKPYTPFEDGLKAINSSNTKYSFFNNTVNALLYGRAFLNTKLYCVLNCSPVIDVAPETVETLALSYELAKLKRKVKPNIEIVDAAEAKKDVLPETPTAEVSQEEPATPSKSDSSTPEAMLASVNAVAAAVVDTSAFEAEIKKLETDLISLRLKNEELVGENERLKTKLSDSSTEFDTKLKTQSEKLQEAQQSISSLKNSTDQRWKLMKTKVVKFTEEVRVISSHSKAASKDVAEKISSTSKFLSSEFTTLVQKIEAVGENFEQAAKQKKLELQQSKQELIQKNSEIEQLNEKLNSSSVELENQKLSLQDKESQLQNVRKLVEEVQQEQNSYKAELEKLQSQLSSKDVEIKQLKDTVSKNESLEGENVLLQKELEDVKNKNKELTKEVDKVQQEMKNTSDQYRDLLITLDGNAKQMESLMSSTETLRAQNLKLRTELEQEKLNATKSAELERIITENTSKLASLEDTISSLKADKENTLNSLTRANEKLISLEAELSGKQSEVSDLKNQIDALQEQKQKELSALVSKNDSQQAEVSQLSSSLKLREEELSQTRQHVTDLESKIAALQTQLTENISSSSESQAAIVTSIQQDLDKSNQKIKDLEAEKISVTTSHNQKVANLEQELLVKSRELEAAHSEKQSVASKLEDKEKYLQQQIDSLSKKNAEFKQETTSVNEQLSKLQEQLSNTLNEKTQTVQKLNDEVASLNVKIVQLKEELAKSSIESQSKISDLTDTLSKKQQDYDTLQKSYEVQVSLASTLRASAKLAEMKQQEMKQQLDMLQEAFNGIEQRLEKKTKEVEESKEKVVQYEEQLKENLKAQEYALQLNSLTAEKQDLENGIQALKTENQEVIQEVERLNNELQLNLSSISSAAMSVKSLGMILTETTKSSQSQKEELKNLQENVKSLQQKNTEVRDKLSALEIEQVTLSGELESLKESSSKNSQVMLQKESEISNLKDNLEKTQADLEAKNQEFTKLKEEKHSVELQLIDKSSLDQDLKAALEESSGKDTIIASKEAEISSRNAKVEELEQKLKDSEQKLEEQQRSSVDPKLVESLKEQLAELQAENTKLKTANKNYEKIQTELNELRNLIKAKAEQRKMEMQQQRENTESRVRRASVMKPQEGKVTKQVAKDAVHVGSKDVETPQQGQSPSTPPPEPVRSEVKEELKVESAVKKEEFVVVPEFKKEDMKKVQEASLASVNNTISPRYEEENAAPVVEQKQPKNVAPSTVFTTTNTSSNNTTATSANSSSLIVSKKASQVELLKATSAYDEFTEAVQKNGYLQKEGGGHKSWKRRFFRITAVEGSLHLGYYTSPSDTKPIKTIDLKSATGVEIADDKNNGSSRLFCFKILTSKRTFYLNASSNDDRLDWMKSLRAIIKKLGAK